MQEAAEKQFKEIKILDEDIITNIPECFCEPLIKVAYKLLCRDNE
jgi:hypothetical protein